MKTTWKLFLPLAGLTFACAAPMAEKTPFPPLAATKDPDRIARGGTIFHASCEACHRGPDQETAAGSQMFDVPGFLGTMYTANLTRHPTEGLGPRSDGEIARMVRYGVTHDGRLSIMPSYGMSDDDLVAVLSFLRSEDPVLAPDPKPTKRPEVSLIGRMALKMVMPSTPPDRPAQGIVAPEKAANAAYGKYLATKVYDCAGCHTPGFKAKTGDEDDAFSGGNTFKDAEGNDVTASNITFHENGIKGWSFEDFRRAVKDGVRNDGTAVSLPMLRVRADDVELAAIYEFLKSVKPQDNKVERKQGAKVAVNSTEATPEQLFTQLGCAACHAKDARFHEKLQQAKSKTVQEVAAWIRNPEATKPGTVMPTYAGIVDEGTALRLAAWVQDPKNGPTAQTTK